MTDSPEPPRLLTMPEGRSALSRLRQSLVGRPAAASEQSQRQHKPAGNQKHPQHGPPTLDAVVESLLFVGSETDRPTPTSQVLRHLKGTTAQQLESSVERINDAYQQRGAPYRVASTNGGWRLTTNEEHHTVALRLSGRDRETKLTKAALEVLSVVAYRGPTTGEELSRFRGKQSGGLLRQLVRQGLLRAERDKKENGRKVQAYTATDAVAGLLGLKSLDDLPKPPRQDATNNECRAAQVH